MRTGSERTPATVISLLLLVIAVVAFFIVSVQKSPEAKLQNLKQSITEAESTKEKLAEETKTLEENITTAENSYSLAQEIQKEIHANESKYRALYERWQTLSEQLGNLTDRTEIMNNIMAPIPGFDPNIFEHTNDGTNMLATAGDILGMFGVPFTNVASDALRSLTPEVLESLDDLYDDSVNYYISGCYSIINLSRGSEVFKMLNTSNNAAQNLAEQIQLLDNYYHETSISEEQSVNYLHNLAKAALNIQTYSLIYGGYLTDSENNEIFLNSLDNITTQFKEALNMFGDKGSNPISYLTEREVLSIYDNAIETQKEIVKETEKAGSEIVCKDKTVGGWGSMDKITTYYHKSNKNLVLCREGRASDCYVFTKDGLLWGYSKFLEGQKIIIFEPDKSKMKVLYDEWGGDTAQKVYDTATSLRKK